MLKRLDHVAIAVKSLDDALRTFQSLIDNSLITVTVEEIPSHHVRVAFLHVGETRLEFLEPTSPESPVAKFLAQRGEGLHHIAFEADDVQSELDRAKGQGFLPIGEPRIGAEHRLVGFLHPKETHRTLIELIQSV
jgi:methylmalonyl-CoA/ethylmalonyl-CoA epimerase